MKTLVFHSDRCAAVLYINGMPIQVQGEVDVTIKEPSKKSKGDANAWAAAVNDSVRAISVSVEK